MRKIFLATLLGTLLMTGTAVAQNQEDYQESFFKARVQTIIEEGPLNGVATQEFGQTLQIKIQDGPYTGEEWIMEASFPLSTKTLKRFDVNDRVVVAETRLGKTVSRNILEPYRLPQMMWAALTFLIVVLLVAGVKAARSLVGLGVSIALVMVWVLPGLIDGQNAFWLSLQAATVIATVTITIAHGFNKKSFLALFSTLLTLGIGTLAGALAVQTTRLFGMGSEDVMFLTFGDFPNLDLRGLLLGAMIIGTLGILDDVTVAQTHLVEELHRANKNLSSLELFKRALNVGREHIASLINTLVIVYVGTSLPILLLITTADQPLWVLLNSEAMAEEIVRTLIGSLSLVLAVPISTYIAARWLPQDSKTI